MGYPALPAAAHAVAGGKRRGGNARRRRGRLDGDFGQIPLVGLAVNPPVILLTYGVVGVSLLWLAIPWPPLSVVIRPLLEGLLWLQNRLVAEAAALPCAAIDYRMTAAQTAVVYLFFVIFTLVAYRPWRKNR